MAIEMAAEFWQIKELEHIAEVWGLEEGTEGEKGEEQEGSWGV